MTTPQYIVIALTAISIAALWLNDIFSFRDKWRERKELRAFKKEEKRTKALEEQVERELIAWTRRSLERTRRQREREARREREAA